MLIISEGRNMKPKTRTKAVQETEQNTAQDAKAIRRGVKAARDARKRNLPVRTAEIIPLTPMQLMRRAVEAGNIELVERMITLQERVDSNAALKAFSDAMCAAQAEMRQVSRDAANPQTRSRYASFGQLDRAMRPIYSRHGFSLSYDTEEGAADGCVRVVCFVAAHGRERKHHLDMPCDGKGAKGGDVMTKTHAMMAAITYARRGLLKMIFNVAEGGDDDGNAAGSSSDPIEKINMEQAQQLKAAIAKCVPFGVDEAYFCKVFGIEAVTELPAAKFEKAMIACEKKAAGAQS
jgi:hypothetical protein